jgi:CheY-like chemotaxis protein
MGMNRAERHGWATGLLGAWAVGAVDPAEEADMRSHLAECATCGAEATRLRDAVEELVDAGEMASPAVWESVLSTIHSRVGPEAEKWLAEGAPASMPRIRVALVDDEADIRDLWRMWLSEAGGFEVVGEAGDGDGAVSLAAREHPDVIVLDLAMPGRSGLEALGRLELCAPSTKILACSSYEELLSEAVGRGAAGGYLKTRGRESLPESLKRLVAS